MAQIPQSAHRNSRFALWKTARLAFCAGTALSLLWLSGCSDRIITPITRADQSEVIYLFEWTKVDGRPALQVDVLFRGNASGESTLILPEAAASEGHVNRDFRNLEALTPSIHLQAGSAANRRKVLHGPGEILHFRYDWVSNTSGDLKRLDLRPVIEESYCAFQAGTALIRPDWPAPRKLNITVRWLKPPSDWKLFGSLGSRDELSGFTGTLSDFSRLVFFGGDFRVRAGKGPSDPLTVAVRGQWPFPDETVFASAREQWRKQRAFWGPEAELPGLFVLLKSPSDCCHFEGTTARDAYVVTASGEEGWGASIQELLREEWFFYPLRQKPESFSPWTLGIVHFFGRSLDLAQGAEPLNAWIADLNRLMEEQSLSRSAAWSEAQLKTRSSEPWARRQYYLRPDLFMQRISQDWLKSGRTFKALFELFKQTALAASGEKSFDDVFLKALEGALKEPLHGLWKAHVVQGEPWVFDARWGENCLKTQSKREAPFELGFDWERTKLERRIHGLNSRTEAARAGLHNGQTLLRWRILFGDPSSTVELWVREKHEEKYLHYLPQALRSTKVFQLTEPEEAESALQCFGRAGLEFSAAPAQ